MKNEKKKRKLQLKEARKHPHMMFGYGYYPGATTTKRRYKKHPALKAFHKLGAFRADNGRDGLQKCARELERNRQTHILNYEDAITDPNVEQSVLFRATHTLSRNNARR